MESSEIREVYVAANAPEAHQLRDVLSKAGIEARVVGEHLNNAVGGLPVDAVTPRIWVHAADYDKARKLIEQVVGRLQQSDKDDQCWKCVECDALNDAGFEICWNCQAERD